MSTRRALATLSLCLLAACEDAAVDDTVSAEAMLTATDLVVTVREDESGSIVLAAEASRAEADLAFEIVDAPRDGTLTGDGAEWVYTPNLDFHGADGFAFRAIWADVASDVGQVLITVTPVNDGPAGTDTTAVTAEDTDVKGVLGAFDVDGDALTYALFSPTELGKVTLDASSGAWTYTPSPDTNGADAFEWRAMDGGGLTSMVHRVDLTVTPVNDAPTAADASILVLEDGTVAGVASGADVDGDALSFAVLDEVEHGTLFLNTATGAHTYTAFANYSGDDAFTFQASDGVLTSSPATVQITVAPQPDVPVAVANTAVTDEDTPISVQLTGSDADGDTLSFSVVGAPGSGFATVEAGTGLLTYTPDADFAGHDSLTFAVSDGGRTSAPAEVAVEVLDVNDAPTLVGASITTREDIAVSGFLVGSDPEGDPLVYRLDDAPLHGAVSVDPTSGSYVFEPEAEYAGLDSFTAVVDDGTDVSEPATVLVAISADNDAPSVEPLALATDEDVPVSGRVAAEDSDGDALLFTVYVAPSHGQLDANRATGDFTYTPDPDWSGTDTFYVRADDGERESPLSAITITVHPANDAPVVEPVTAQTREHEDLVLVLTATDIDGDTVSWLVDTPPEVGTLDLDGPTGVAVYEPPTNGSNVDTFWVVAFDGTDVSDPALVVVVIEAVNDPPQLDAAVVETVMGQEVTYALSATDPEGDAVTFAIASNAGHGAATVSADGVFTYFPDPDFDGTDLVLVSVSDGNASATGSVVVRVFGDADGDGKDDEHDTCPEVSDPDQEDANGNGVGDACDCVEESFASGLSAEVLSLWRGATATESDLATDNAVVKLAGLDAEIRTVPIDVSSCGGIAWEVAAAAGSPVPEDGEALEIYLRTDGGPWMLLDALTSQGATSSAFRDRRGSSAGPASTAELRVALHVNDWSNDVFLVDRIYLGCDSDGDEVGDCAEVTRGGDAANPDTDGDGLDDGDELLGHTGIDAPDTDADTAPDGADNCPMTANADQADWDDDGVGDACEVGLADDFESGSIDPEVWLNFDGGSNLSITTANPYSGSASAKIGNTARLESVPLDLSHCGSAAWDMMVYRYAVPSSQRLYIEMLAGSGAWEPFDTLPGVDTSAAYTRVRGSTEDPAVLRPDSQFRLRTSLNGASPYFQVDQLYFGCDVDRDGLADVAEDKLYFTDANLPDTDADGLLDGEELETDPLDPDTDDDGKPDGVDNCPGLRNPNQADSDGDGRGDACSYDFYEAFQSTLDGSRWAPLSGQAYLSSWSARSPSNHVYFYGSGSGTLTSTSQEVRRCTKVATLFWVRRATYYYAPQTNDSFKFESWDGTTWVTQTTVKGNGYQDSQYLAYGGAIPKVQNQANGAQFRFTTQMSTYAYFLLDDIRIGCDADADGLPDQAELQELKTNPNKEDTDGDGIDDATEVLVNRTNPTDPTSF